MKTTLLISFLLILSGQAIAQDLTLNTGDNVLNEEAVTYNSAIRGRRSYNNQLGIGGDYVAYTLDTDNASTSTGNGFSGYLETRGAFRDHFDLIYGIGIYSYNFEVQELLLDRAIELNQIGAQIKFLLAWKIAESKNFSIEAGPALMISGDYKLDDDRDEDSIVGTVTNPIEIEEFLKTPFANLNGIIGFSAGVRHVRLTAHYNYSFFNALAGSSISGTDLKGTASYLSAGLRVYF